MQQIKAQRTLSRRRAWPLAIIAGGVVIWGLPSSSEAASTCTDTNCPTDFITLVSPQIQSTKTSFKFQARISQAKLPVDDVQFAKVIVKLRDGTNTWCSQTLSNVKVRDSVLNLEVGPDTGMTCSMPLEDVIAGKNGLGFQICINNEENCLKPVALSSTPYAVKAEYARRAQQSFEADVAAQAHYAHRIAADLDLLQAPTIGTGYYDFHTPLTSTVVPGLNTPISNKEGVMQWTPVASAERKLNLAVKVEANGSTPASLQRLDELKVHAIMTRDLGKLEVSDTTKLFSTLDVTGATTLNSTLLTVGATNLQNTLAVTGATTLSNTLSVSGATTMASTLGVNGAATFSNTVGVTGATTLNSTLLAKGATTIQNTLGVTGATTLGAGLGVTGASTFAGSLSVTGSNPTTLGGTLGVSGATQINNTLQVSNGTVLSSTLDVSGQSTLTTLRVPSAGSATFDGTVNFNGPVNLPSAGVSTSSLNVTGTATVNSLSLPFGALRMGTMDNVRFGPLTTQTTAFGASATASTIAGGTNNSITGSYSIIGAGTWNSVSGSYSNMGGGSQNILAGDYSVIGGGIYNQTTSTIATIAGGSSNTAGNYATVGGGTSNTATGVFSTIPGGRNNYAQADYSFAAGYRAKSTAVGSFTWADSTEADFTNSTANSFKVRASGGIYLYNTTTGTAGLFLGTGAGSWASISDRNLKHQINEIDPQAVLAKLEKVPVATWRYKAEETQALHMGPMAQDFYAAFGLGGDETHIVTVDADGVALAAIKGVHAITKQQSANIDSLNQEVVKLRRENRSLEERLSKLESRGGLRSSLPSTGMLGGLGFAALGWLLAASSRRRKDLP